MKYAWAFDLGASNGRLMVSGFDGKKLHLEEIHRFSNHPVHLTGHYYWDILRIYQEMKNGMLKSIQKGYKKMESLSIDTWGVDFGFISANGELLGNPYSYRDPQTIESFKKIIEIVPKEELFRRTGVEPAAINTICQLYAIKEQNQRLLENADTLLLTPNLIGYLLSGVKANEYTISTTTSLYHFHHRQWDHTLMEKLNLPSNLMADIVETGTVLGPTLDSINREVGISPVKVIAGAGHDTACALAALPVKKENAAFMSCGTWILIGVQVSEPVVTAEALDWGFTNEGTADGEYRLLKNTMGLWLIQECRSAWLKEGKPISYEQEDQLIRKTKPFQTLIDPDDPVFFNPEHMPRQIRDYCVKTKQKTPESDGDFLRCILESLALKYRWVIEKLEKLTGKPIERIHMGGGGIQNRFLCQFTANATQRMVTAGPIEASAIGNSLTQWIALGEMKDLQEGREIVEQSFPMKAYEPENQLEWQDAYGKFLQLFRH
ncbi:rhamnulokinase [Neobacillus vireti]|uniref:Yulc n=1 Tax=Neobacillus vireti LMG 21834 TaxID=1131730 RepID=A0AB94IJL4_9BACI|nr:rhamnulokinase family protein [Neobacillus vireti]ETI67301.1 yulc [Neobacillus vireti LMG 21834]KLT18032.1 rhamnulokinase [Neobacillus vireti]